MEGETFKSNESQINDSRCCGLSLLRTPNYVPKVPAITGVGCIYWINKQFKEQRWIKLETPTFSAMTQVLCEASSSDSHISVIENAFREPEDPSSPITILYKQLKTPQEVFDN